MQPDPQRKYALLFTLFLSVFAGLSTIMPANAAKPDDATLSGSAIVSRAHEVAGGAVWQRPVTLHLRGRAIVYENGVLATRTVADHYEMWRVFPEWNTTAHNPSGKVRIDAYSGGKTLFQIAYDGKNTYNQNGLVPGAKASVEWSEAFGFGIIRFALDKGFSITRLADDQVEGHPSFNVSVRDPAGSTTLFWIDSKNYAIRKVGFDTPRGWHERIYSDFKYHENPHFQQATHVRLFYRGALTNDITWEQYDVNQPIADSVFVIDTPKPAMEGNAAGAKTP